MTKVDGMRGGNNGGLNASNANFDFDVTPRLTVGRVGPGGLGIRARWWDYNHDKITPNGQRVIADTSIIDVELFDRFLLGCTTWGEWSIGARYHEFDIDRDGSSDAYSLDKAFGGIAGIQLNRRFWHGEIYGRGRAGIVVGEQGIIQGQGLVTTNMLRPHTELAAGYRISHCTPHGVLSGFAGYEWHYWDGYVGSNVGGDDVLVGIGFDGFHVGIGFQY
jgi:hypothetical protein